MSTTTEAAKWQSIVIDMHRFHQRYGYYPTLQDAATPEQARAKMDALRAILEADSQDVQHGDR